MILAKYFDFLKPSSQKITKSLKGIKGNFVSYALKNKEDGC